VRLKKHIFANSLKKLSSLQKCWRWSSKFLSELIKNAHCKLHSNENYNSRCILMLSLK
jgi:hypothetical protein